MFVSIFLAVLPSLFCQVCTSLTLSLTLSTYGPPFCLSCCILILIPFIYDLHCIALRACDITWQKLRRSFAYSCRIFLANHRRLQTVVGWMACDKTCHTMALERSSSSLVNLYTPRNAFCPIVKSKTREFPLNLKNVSGREVLRIFLSTVLHKTVSLQSASDGKTCN